MSLHSSLALPSATMAMDTLAFSSPLPPWIPMLPHLGRLGACYIYTYLGLATYILGTGNMPHTQHRGV